MRDPAERLMRAVEIVALCALCALAHQARAAEIKVLALTSGKAVISIDGGKPIGLSAGDTTKDGVKLISADSQSAVIELGGRRQTVAMGGAYSLGSSSGGAAGQSIVIPADARGHFLSVGSINGAAVQFLVDTGATMVSISADDAKRAGIDYRKGEQGFSRTASGLTPVFKVKLDTVRLGNITLHNVDGLVHVGGGLPIALLGMSFLNRMEMRRDGQALTLIKRF